MCWQSIYVAGCLSSIWVHGYCCDHTVSLYVCMQVSQLRHDLSMKDELLQFYTSAAEESDGESASTTPWVHILDNRFTWYLCHGQDWYLKLCGCYYFSILPDKCTHLAKYGIFSEDISVYWRRHISL